MEIKFNLNSKQTEALIRYSKSSDKELRNIVKEILINELKDSGSFKNFNKKSNNQNLAPLTIKGSYDAGIWALDEYNLKQEIDKLIVSLLNFCFSLETSFKTLHNLKKTNYNKTHDLYKLFQLLPEDIKNSAIKYVISIFENLGRTNIKTTKDFNKMLEDHSMLYVELRYFELDPKQGGFQFNADFIISLSDFIIDITLNLIDPNRKSKKRIVLQIKEIREKSNITFDFLREKLGVTSYVLNSYENNFKIPSIETLTKISEILNVKIDELILNEK